MKASALDKALAQFKAERDTLDIIITKLEANRSEKAQTARKPRRVKKSEVEG